MTGQVTDNLINRQSSAIPLNAVDVFKMSNFPAPSGGVITLTNNTLWNIKAPLVTSDRFEIPAGGNVAFQGFNTNVNTLVYTGTSTFFTGTDKIVSFFVDALVFVGAVPGASLFNLIGDESAGSFVALFLNTTVGFTSLGSIKNFASYSGSSANYIGFSNGLTLEDCPISDVFKTGFFGSGAGTGAHINIIGNKTRVITIGPMPLAANVSESGFFIDPDILNTGQVSFNRVQFSGNGAFFKSGTTGIIEGFSDFSVAATSITSVTEPLEGTARFNFTVGPTLFVDQEVVVSGFSGGNAAYNHTARITATGAGFFETGVAFANGGTGSFLSNSVRVIDAEHGLSTAQTLLIQNSINYNQGAKIYGVTTDNFRINAVFVVEIPGPTVQWNTGSLVETDKRVDLRLSGAQKPSMNIAFGVVNDNAVATVIAAADTYQALDVSGFTSNGVTERWTLTDATAGIFRYDGQNPFVGRVAANITIVKTGSTETFDFATSLNGAIPTFPTADHIPIEVKTTKVSGVLLDTLDINPGDTIQIMGAGDSTSNNITITDFQFEITGD